MKINAASAADLDRLAELRVALWPEDSAYEHRAGAAELLADPERFFTAVARDEAGIPVAFAEASIRRDYVNGCETSPVLFLEGIYTDPSHRRRGAAAALVRLAAEWGRARGCREFASDVLLDNHASHAFHEAIGFDETERVVYFRQPL